MTGHARSLRAGQVGPAEGDGRTIPVRLVAWGTPENVTDDGRLWYREVFERGDLTPSEDRMLVRNEHSGAVVGRIADVIERSDGPYGMVRVADTADGRDVLAMNDEGLLDASMEFEHSANPSRAGELVRRAGAVLTGLAFTLKPQYRTVAVLGRRSIPEETSMPSIDDALLTPEPLVPDPAPAPAPPDPEPAVHARSTAGVHQLQTVGRAAGQLTERATEAPVGRFRSFGEFVRAAALREIPVETRQRYYRALSTAATTDAPGLFGNEAWINEIIDLRRNRTPTASLFAQRPLPPSGLTINQPTIIQRPLVGVVGELEQIPSQKVKIGSTSWDVATYGGGQGMSIQLIERSDPSYLNEVYRMYVTEMSLDFEADVAAAVLAASDDTHSAQEVTTTNGAHGDAFIDAAALLMGAATIQSPPEVLAMSVGMWVLLAKAKDGSNRPLFPTLNPMNAHGTMSLRDMDGGNFMDLNYAVIPTWAGKVAVMGVREAFRTMVGPIQTMQADVPENLSREYAVYQFAAFGAVDTAGLVRIVDT